MIWGCMGWEGIGNLAEDERRMDANHYVDILKTNLLSSLDKLRISPENVIFQ